MGSQAGSDEIIRQLAGEFRVMTLDGLAVIASGLSRNTFDADIWVEPMDTADCWAKGIAPFIYAAGSAEAVAIGSWEKIPRDELAAVIERDGVIRINGLGRPLDIFAIPTSSICRISTRSGSGPSPWMTARVYLIRSTCWSVSRKPVATKIRRISFSSRVKSKRITSRASHGPRGTKRCKCSIVSSPRAWPRLRRRIPIRRCVTWDGDFCASWRRKVILSRRRFCGKSGSRGNGQG